MRKDELKVSVFVVEESDLSGVNEEARVSGKLESVRAAIADNFDRTVRVQVGMADDPRRGSVPWVSVAGVRLFAGEAVAFFPSGPQRVDAPEVPKPAKKVAKKAAKKKA